MRQFVNCKIDQKSFGWASCHGQETHLYHVTHNDFPGQEFTIAKHSFRVEFACESEDDIFEDEHTPSASTQQVGTEDPNNNILQEFTTDELSWAWVQVPQGHGLTRGNIVELH